MAKRFTVGITVVVLSVVTLVFVIECIENLRRASNHDRGIDVVLMLSALRLPWLIEQVLPFAVLIGGIVAFLSLSRSHELTVARSIGMSAWQFVGMVAVMAAAIGLLTSMAFNPLAAGLLQTHSERFEQAFGDNSGRLSNKWLRQTADSGASVMRAGSVLASGLDLRSVTVFVFDSQGRFIERLEADRAELRDQAWLLQGVWVIAPGEDPAFEPEKSLPTTLSAEQITESFIDHDFVSFWDLPRQIEIARQSELNSARYQLQYQALLARPVFFVAMVMIAAVVSLRVFRFGNISWMILSGIAGGFLLYVVMQIVGDLGATGFVHPVAAAWVPPLVTLALATALLLTTEDG
ncbi:MAG: LPS export ABC transporter permease LptG [Pseudomonadota bacterium]